jgi:hypothetical protein
VKVLATFLFLITASTAMGACLDVGGSLDAPEPVWSSGYVYSFSEHGLYRVKSSGSGPDGGGSRDQEETFGPHEVVYEVLNTTLKSADGSDTYLVALAREENGGANDAVQVQAPNGQTMQVDAPKRNVVLGAVRQKDLQDLPVIWNLDEDCLNRVCKLALQSVLIGAGAQWTLLDFPLKTGKEWTASLQDDVDELDDIKIRMHAEVDGKAKAKTPLGSINAVRIAYDFKPENVDEVKDQIRSDAEEEGIDIKSLDLDIKVHTLLYYSPVYENVVRVERTFDQSFAIKGREDGKDFSFAFENHVEFVRELTGARLVSYPERDLAAIGRVLVGDSPLANPAGEAFRPVGYTVQIEADNESINAANGESASFRAVLKGVQTLPTGHTALWKVVDAFGQSREAGAGLTLDFKPDAPGMYVVEVETRDANGNITSAAAQPLAANFIATKRPACGQIVLPFVLTTTCESMNVPVRPGISSLKVSARIGGTLASLGQGELRLTDAAGRVTRDTSRSGNEYSISMGGEDPLNPRGVGAKDWTLVYAPQRSVQETAEYSVELLFGEPLVTAMPAKRAGAAAAMLDHMLQSMREQTAAGVAPV